MGDGAIPTECTATCHPPRCASIITRSRSPLVAHEKSTGRRIAVLLTDGCRAPTDDTVGEVFQRRALPIRIEARRQSPLRSLVRIELEHETEPHWKTRLITPEQLPNGKLLIEAAGKPHRSLHSRRHSHPQTIIDRVTKCLCQHGAVISWHGAKGHLGSTFNGAAVQAAVRKSTEDSAIGV